jgi:hypothetical protein
VVFWKVNAEISDVLPKAGFYGISKSILIYSGFSGINKLGLFNT